jgi:hypothetical protein
MSNLLQASSLLLAVLALVYSQWYPEIRTARQHGHNQIDNHQEHRLDWTEQFREVNEVFWNRTVPLFVSALLLVIVLLPDAVSIVVSTANTYIARGLKAIWSYDAVSTIYVLAVLLTAGFCVHLFRTFESVRNLKNDLNTERLREVLEIATPSNDDHCEITVRDKRLRNNSLLVDRYVVKNLNEILKKKCGASDDQRLQRKTMNLYKYTMTAKQYECLCDSLYVKPNTSTS